MSTSDAEQKGPMVRYHARMAQGVKLDGTSLEPKGGSNQGKGSNSQPAKRTGGLSGAKKSNA
jgi:hypothetical protein